ncbi:hypothetical protein Neosp_011248 [[Neocosmospora] mangrovei]
MDDPEAVWHALSPDGLAAGILAVTIFFSITTTIMLLLRAYVRTTHRLNGTEDYLMYIGGVLNLGHNAVVMYACFTGLGTRDAKLNLPIMIEGAKAVTVWQLLYIISSPFIKVSICANLIRVAMKRRYTIPLQAMSGLAIAMSVMAFIVVFIQCRPFEASWTGQGKCITVDVIIIPTYVFSAANILVDWVVSILPAFIVWNLQLRRKLKLLSFGILGVDKIGFIILWTVVELSLGILAGSLPSLRKFFKSLAKDQSTGEHGNIYGSDLVTIGGGGNSAKPQRSGAYELNTTVVGRKSESRDGNSDGVTDGDNDSTSRIIHVTRNVTQTREWERLG